MKSLQMLEEGLEYKRETNRMTTNYRGSKGNSEIQGEL
jgi:hypothetical protein